MPRRGSMAWQALATGARIGHREVAADAVGVTERRRASGRSGLLRRSGASHAYRTALVAQHSLRCRRNGASRRCEADTVSCRRPLRVDDDAIRVVEREHAVTRHVLQVEHDARRVVRMPAEADVAHDVGVVAERRIDQGRDRPGALQIEKQPRRSFDSLLIERHFAIELDRDAHHFRQYLALHGANGRSRWRTARLALQRLGAADDRCVSRQLLDLRRRLRREAAVRVLIAQPLEQLNRAVLDRAPRRSARTRPSKGSPPARARCPRSRSTDTAGRSSSIC